MLDDNHDGLLNFREVTGGLSLVASRDITIKLRLFYILHLPPLLHHNDMESPPPPFGNYNKYCQ